MIRKFVAILAGMAALVGIGWAADLPAASAAGTAGTPVKIRNAWSRDGHVRPGDLRCALPNGTRPHPDGTAWAVHAGTPHGRTVDVSQALRPGTYWVEERATCGTVSRTWWERVTVGRPHRRPVIGTVSEAEAAKLIKRMNSGCLTVSGTRAIAHGTGHLYTRGSRTWRTLTYAADRNAMFTGVRVIFRRGCARYVVLEYGPDTDEQYTRGHRHSVLYVY